MPIKIYQFSLIALLRCISVRVDRLIKFHLTQNTMRIIMPRDSIVPCNYIIEYCIDNVHVCTCVWNTYTVESLERVSKLKTNYIHIMDICM